MTTFDKQFDIKAPLRLQGPTISVVLGRFVEKENSLLELNFVGKLITLSDKYIRFG